ncbi:MAG: sorbosone dehydrogenase family protein [Gemmatimonadetes bacterium]|nr:sorbosone dehydrogenase family protein [Gemmatimonadota bacterium]
MLRRVTLNSPLAAVLALYATGACAQQPASLDRITLPPGFSIEIYAEGLSNPRSMVLAPNGTLFVGTRGAPPTLARGVSADAGQVYAILDLDNDQKADRVITIDSGLNAPNGVAFRDGSLYVAEINRILRYDGIESRLDDPPEPVVVSDAFPSDWMHGWKFIAFGPDDKLYVPVGGPCNVCDREDEEPRYASITRMNPDGSDLEVFASGIRNSVGFDWHPVTNELWFTSNGRDGLGDETPPDVLNRADRQGMHFGFPFCHAGDLPDPQFGDSRRCSEFAPPALDLGPHVAALGMRFYTGDMFPERYRNQIFIAEHGSWNRSPAAGHTGYRLMVVHLDGNRPVEYEVFAEGWLQENNTAWGRPVDVLVMPDGALLLTDDGAGVIYRISYSR